MNEELKSEIIRFFNIKKIGCSINKEIESPRFLNLGINLSNPFDIEKITAKTLKQLNAFFHTKDFQYYEVEGSHFGLALPYKDFNKVELEGLLNQYERKYDKQEIVIPIGKDMNGNIVEVNFDKAPHILIAGSTGSGKSVLMDTIIASTMNLTSPLNTYFYFFDPKRVGFKKWAYRSDCFPHEYITDTDKIIDKLKWLVRKMEMRYELMAQNNLTNFRDLGLDEGRDTFVFVDELADLMLTSNFEVEECLVKLAQKGRGCGFHLILATQNPLAKVCSSLLKANMPCKIALKCSNMRQSMVILDHKGGESLLGQGDSIISLPYLTNEIRFQSAIIREDSVRQIIDTQWKIRDMWEESPQGQDFINKKLALYNQQLNELERNNN